MLYIKYTYITCEKVGWHGIWKNTHLESISPQGAMIYKLGMYLVSRSNLQ